MSNRIRLHIIIPLLWLSIGAGASVLPAQTQTPPKKPAAKPAAKRGNMDPSVVAAVDAMNSATKAQDAKAMAKLWDMKGLLITADRRLDLPKAFMRQIDAVAKGMAPKLIGGLVAPGSGLKFERCSYERAEISKDGNRTAITVRLWRGGENDTWMKFWLTRKNADAAWQFYDYLAIDVGLYMSDLVGAALKGATSRNRAEKKTFIAFSELLKKFAARNYDGLLKPVLALNSSHLPKALRGMKSFMLMCLYCREPDGRPTARKIAEDGISVGYDLPALHLSHAYNLCALEDYDTALLAIEEWGKSVAKDDAYYEVRGDALAGKGEKRLAFKEYVKAFNDNPANQDVVLRAMDILPPAQKGTVAQFIPAASNPRSLAKRLINELEPAGHKQAVGAVITALEKRAPKDPALASYRKRLAAMK